MQKKSFKVGLGIVFLMLAQPTYAQEMVGTGYDMLINTKTNKPVKYLARNEKVNKIGGTRDSPIITYNGKTYKIGGAGVMTLDENKEYLENYAPKYRYLDRDPRTELESIESYPEIKEFVENFKPKGNTLEEQLKDVIAYMGTYNLKFGAKGNESQLATIETDHMTACGGITTILVNLLDKTEIPYRVVIERSGNYAKEKESKLIGHIYPEVKINSKWLVLDSSHFTRDINQREGFITYEMSKKRYSAITQKILGTERNYNNNIQITNILATDSDNEDLRFRVGNTYLKGQEQDKSGFVLYLNKITLLKYIRQQVEKQ